MQPPQGRPAAEAGRHASAQGAEAAAGHDLRPRRDAARAGSVAAVPARHRLDRLTRDLDGGAVIEGVRRALPSIAAALAVTGLLAAAVIAAPDPSPRRGGRAPHSAGPLALMRDRPTGATPRLEQFEEPEPAHPAQPASPAPPLDPIRSLAPDPPRQPSRALGQPWHGRLENGVQ